MNKAESTIAVEEAFQRARGFPEDAVMENGNYLNQCVVCDATFRGHKRRVLCRDCDPLARTTNAGEKNDS